MIEATLELTVPLIVAAIIDNGIAAGDKQYIRSHAVLMIVVAAAGLMFSITAQYFAASASVNFVKNLKNGIYSKVQYFSFEQFDKAGSSTLITRLTSDMESIQNGLNLTLRLLLRSPFVVAGACIMAMRLDLKTSLIFIVTVVLLSLVVFGIMSITVPLNKKVRSALDGALLTTRETVTGIRVIRAFAAEKAQADEFERKNKELTQMQERAGRISALLNPVTVLIINAAVSVLIYAGARKVDTGSLTTGTLVALYNYMSQILVELIKLANLTVTLSKSLSCAQRVSELLDAEEENVPKYTGESESRDYIAFENVGFSYSGSQEPVLSNISFTVKEGETVGIIGATGSGKSTLVNLISRFYLPGEGEIFIDGKNIKNYSKAEISDMVSFTEQKPVIFKGTVRSNLTMGKNISDEKLHAALKCAQAEEFVMEKDGGIDAETEQYGRNFSGGQRQRIAVARAVAEDSDILILDDASSALDYMTDSMMRAEIFKLNRKAVFIVSQRTGSIMNCDKIILLEDGKTTIGTHSELLENSVTYREIHQTQFEEDEAV